MASNYILSEQEELKELRDRDIKARRGYINDVGEYVPYEKDRSDGWREGRKNESFTYMPPAMKKRQAKREAMLKEIDEAERKNREAKKKYLKEATPEEKLYPDIYTARKKKESQSKYFPQTGTRSDEEKGFFSGLYDKTIGEYQRGQDEKERLKEETKAAMAAEPDPFVKKEIARKGHAEYMKIAATEGQGERDRERIGTEGLQGYKDALRQQKEDRQREAKDARVKEYKGFTDEAALIARERAMGGQRAIVEGEGSEEALRQALPFHRAAEREKYGGVGEKMLEERINREKGLMNIGSLPPSERAKLESAEAGGERMDFDDSSIAGRTSWRGSSEERRKQKEAREGVSTTEAMREELGGKSIPFTEEKAEEMGGKSLAFDDPEIAGDPNAPGIKEWKAAMDVADTELATAKDDEARRLERKNESGIEGIGTQEQAQEAIASLDEEEAEETVDIIKREKGQGEEWIDAKEAIRDKNGRQRYVRYEGSGLHIDMSLLEKDIDRNHFFKNILPNTPPESRLALMAERNYISDKDLTVAQKKSAKQIKELEILNLEASKLKTEAEKASRALSPEKKLKYEQSMIGFRQATKDKDWDTATLYASQMREMGMPLSEFDPVALQAASDAKLLGKHPPMISIAKKYGIMSASGKPSVLPFYKQQGALSLKLSFLGKDASSGGGTLDLNEKIHTGSKITFGEILNYNGIETWDKVKGRMDEGGNDPISIALAKSMGLESLKGISREAYLHYAKSKAHDVISRSVWGPAYDEIKQAGIQSRETIRKDGEDAFKYSPMGKGTTKKTADGKGFLTFAGEHDDGRETVDSGLSKMAKERVVTNKADAKANKIKAEKKAKAGKANAFRKEKENDRRLIRKGKSMVPMTLSEKESAYMKEGTKRLDALVKGRTIRGRKKPLQGHPEFNSTEQAIKYYKDNPSKLKEMSLAFRHFISQK